MPNTRDTTQKIPPDAEIIARAWALSQTPITDLIGTRAGNKITKRCWYAFLSFI